MKRSRIAGPVSLLALLFLTVAANAGDWLHWRGPYQTGFSPETNLPSDWDPRNPGQKNLVWKAPYGCRSTPLVMDGKIYLIGAANESLNVPTTKEKINIGERVVCLNAADGKQVWEQQFNVFHTDIVANRLGWSPLAGDAKNKRIYAHTTAGFLCCFDATSGKILWQRQLTEEFGRVTGYGGRIGGGPIFDSGMVIVGLVNASWGSMAIGGNRLFAFDGETGKVVWIAETPNITVPGTLKSTYYSNPVVAVIAGQRLLVTGGADGGVHAFQVRTGKPVWSRIIATGVVNGSPVVDGNLVYICHGEENPEGGSVGRVICLDASKIVGGKPEIVWDFRGGFRFGLAAMALHDGKLYCPDDGAKLYCFDAKKGPKNNKPLWKISYGTVSRGAPVIADGKLFISESNARFSIITLPKDGSAPDEDADMHTVTFKPKPGAQGFVESHCTPAIVDGRIYLANRDELFCIGKKGVAPTALQYKPEPKEEQGQAVATQAMLYPAEVAVAPGETVAFEIRCFNAQGVLVPGAEKKIQWKWSLPAPPIPKGAMLAPPALDAVMDNAKNSIMVNPKKPSQHGVVEITDGAITARARVRVLAQIPYKQDFEMLPVGAVPGGWLNTQGKYRVVELMENGVKNKVLFKVNNNPVPPIARANGYIISTSSTNYTIESDMMTKPAGGKLGDMGVIANRYLLIMDPKTTTDQPVPQLRLVTWEALPPDPPGRISDAKPFAWKGETWYRVKLSVEITEKEALVRGKAWERGKAEPAEWIVELRDPRPNREGAAAIYGYVSNATADAPGAEIYYDNVAISPNNVKK